ncbi:hypothetical protein [uncultured Rikenella sp.]|uniref:chorismate transformation enzyme, FkbO/Hyg5 family n=1 Tax=uncultured Rikenella sp. TaxID=368003 RepID=UPI0026257BD3|nr:hypothetical protein [uncultured Rikenella sp.]
MGFNVVYHIDKVWFRDFGEMVGEMLDKLTVTCERGHIVPLRLVFFGNPDDNRQYTAHREWLLGLIRERCERFGWRMPLVSYVAQKSLDSGLVMESQCIPQEKSPLVQDKAIVTAAGRVRYFTVETEEGKRLFTEGILPSSIDAPILEQSTEVLGKLGTVLDAEQMDINTIVRQWNYIERITHVPEYEGANQHYQDFNDARSHFYAKTRWEKGYPAATGIGTSHGGIMVEVDAAVLKCRKCAAVALDNALQVAAHDYSQNVLIGVADKIFRHKTTPKFERAKAVITPASGLQVYISGTAAIRGETSLADVGIERQTLTTLENIEYLISRRNLRKHGIKAEKTPEIQIFRVYLKSENLLEPARKIICEKYPHVEALYVLTDVCRDELLIEIEGVAVAEDCG